MGVGKGKLNMVKRTSYRHYYYLLFAFLVLIASWESSRTNAAAFEGDIPNQAIRLRILANSDALQDQAVKRAVRDRVMAVIDSWQEKPATIEEERETIRRHMPEIEAAVGAQLRESGYAYGFRAELGEVPFPIKTFAGRIYPAGDYEALRITLGAGAGQNWWCVLFPPLCLVSTVTKAPDKKANVVSAASLSQTSAADSEIAVAAPEPELHSYVWDKMKQLRSWAKAKW